jgi:hypothetical protein
MNSAPDYPKKGRQATDSGRRRRRQAWPAAALALRLEFDCLGRSK